uniref:COesterase domain-containing protein n=1 Tax=Macrostomum lignano TaxID=282301 RepID=A0A1I8F6K1_9PLAT
SLCTRRCSQKGPYPIGHPVQHPRAPQVLDFLNALASYFGIAKAQWRRRVLRPLRNEQRALTGTWGQRRSCGRPSSWAYRLQMVHARASLLDQRSGPACFSDYVSTSPLKLKAESSGSPPACRMKTRPPTLPISLQRRASRWDKVEPNPGLRFVAKMLFEFACEPIGSEFYAARVPAPAYFNQRPFRYSNVPIGVFTNHAGPAAPVRGPLEGRSANGAIYCDTL